MLNLFMKNRSKGYQRNPNLEALERRLMDARHQAHTAHEKHQIAAKKFWDGISGFSVNPFSCPAETALTRGTAAYRDLKTPEAKALYVAHQDLILARTREATLRAMILKIETVKGKDRDQS